MKTLLFGIVLIIVIGLGGFFYRDVMERTNPGGGNVTACTLEAKLCPDGSAVGRMGPSCAFAPCPPPNVEVTDASIAFIMPEDYAADENAYGADPSLIATFVKPASFEEAPHTIIIRQHPIPEGQTADDVMLRHTVYYPADMQAENFDRFDTMLINGTTYRTTVIERFEAIVHSAFYLARANDVLRFDIIEHDVTDWINPDLSVIELPEHRALIRLLERLQVAP
ncbi:hypothetical protein L0Y34_00955 [Candidatus Parcubacteria bacterium]|nr:hypothetical protein [Candidatus Parcubacteria bacterium]